MNLIKKGLLVVVLFSFTILIEAQVNFGIIGGLNLANVNDELDTKNYTSFHFGGFMNLELNDLFSFQPELLFTGKGFKLSFITMSNYTIRNEFNLYYLEFPILLKISSKDYKGIRAFGAIGPYFGIGLAEQYQTNFNGQTYSQKLNWWNYESLYKRLDLGITLKGGIEIHNVIFSLYYDLGLNNILSDDSNHSMSNRVLGFSLGYIFK